MGCGCSCCRDPTPEELAWQALQRLQRSKLVPRPEVKALAKEFKTMDRNRSGWIDGDDAAAAGLPPKVWRGILAAATADVGGTPTRLCFPEFALLAISHSGNKAAERALLLLRAHCAFESVATRLRSKAGEKKKEEKKPKKLKPGEELPKPRKGRRKSTLGREEVWDAVQMINKGGETLPAIHTEMDVGPRMFKKSKKRKGRLTREEFQAMVLAERPELLAAGGGDAAAAAEPDPEEEGEEEEGEGLPGAPPKPKKKPLVGPGGVKLAGPAGAMARKLALTKSQPPTGT